MRSALLILALAVLASIAAACGGASSSDPTEAVPPSPAESQATDPTEAVPPSPAESQATDSAEAGLRSRAESQATAQSNEKWAEWYGFLSPDSKSGCSESNFSAAADLGISGFKQSRGLEESAKLEFRVQEVTVQGNHGQVGMDMYLDGELIFDSPDELWFYVDGDWWSVFMVAVCRSPAPTLVPAGTSDGSFDEADMRALFSDEEVEAAIPLVIGRMPPITDMRGLAGDEGMAGMDSIWGQLYPSVAGGQLMVIVTDFVSPEILQQQIAMWIVRDSLKFTEPTIGDGSLQGQEGDTVSLRFWKGDKAVLLTATDLSGTQEVLDGLIALAELAASRLSPG